MKPKTQSETELLHEAAAAAALGCYKGLAVRRKYIAVTPRTIEAELARRCLRAGTELSTAQPARRGDKAVLSFEGFFADAPDTPIPDSRGERITVLLGSGTMLPGAEKAVCGHTAGESFLVPFTYPRPFRVEALAGREAFFRIVLHEVLRRTPLPAEQLAAAEGYENEEALRKTLRPEAVAEAILTRRVRALLLKTAQVSGENETTGPAPEDEVRKQ